MIRDAKDRFAVDSQIGTAKYFYGNVGDWEFRPWELEGTGNIWGLQSPIIVGGEKKMLFSTTLYNMSTWADDFRALWGTPVSPLGNNDIPYGVYIADPDFTNAEPIFYWWGTQASTNPAVCYVSCLQAIPGTEHFLVVIIVSSANIGTIDIAGTNTTTAKGDVIIARINAATQTALWVRKWTIRDKLNGAPVGISSLVKANFNPISKRLCFMVRYQVDSPSSTYAPAKITPYNKTTFDGPSGTVVGMVWCVVDSEDGQSIAYAAQASVGTYADGEELWADDQGRLYMMAMNTNFSTATQNYTFGGKTLSVQGTCMGIWTFASPDTLSGAKGQTFTSASNWVQGFIVRYGLCVGVGNYGYVGVTKYYGGTNPVTIGGVDYSWDADEVKAFILKVDPTAADGSILSMFWKTSDYTSVGGIGTISIERCGLESLVALLRFTGTGVTDAGYFVIGNQTYTLPVYDDGVDTFANTGFLFIGLDAAAAIEWSFIFGDETGGQWWPFIGLNWNCYWNGEEAYLGTVYSEAAVDFGDGPVPYTATYDTIRIEREGPLDSEGKSYEDGYLVSRFWIEIHQVEASTTGPPLTFATDGLYQEWDEVDVSRALVGRTTGGPSLLAGAYVFENGPVGDSSSAHTFYNLAGTATQEAGFVTRMDADTGANKSLLHHFDVGGTDCTVQWLSGIEGSTDYLVCVKVDTGTHTILGTSRDEGSIVLARITEGGTVSWQTAWRWYDALGPLDVFARGPHDVNVTGNRIAFWQSNSDSSVSGGTIETPLNTYNLGGTLNEQQRVLFSSVNLTTGAVAVERIDTWSAASGTNMGLEGFVVTDNQALVIKWHNKTNGAASMSIGGVNANFSEQYVTGIWVFPSADSFTGGEVYLSSATGATIDLVIAGTMQTMARAGNKAFFTIMGQNNGSLNGTISLGGHSFAVLPIPISGYTGFGNRAAAIYRLDVTASAGSRIIKILDEHFTQPNDIYDIFVRSADSVGVFSPRADCLVLQLYGRQGTNTVLPYRIKFAGKTVSLTHTRTWGEFGAFMIYEIDGDDLIERNLAVARSYSSADGANWLANPPYPSPSWTSGGGVSYVRMWDSWGIEPNGSSFNHDAITPPVGDMLLGDGQNDSQTEFTVSYWGMLMNLITIPAF